MYRIKQCIFPCHSNAIFQPQQINTSALQVFMGYDSDNSQIVLSFRGTSNLEDWVDNLGICSTLMNTKSSHHYIFTISLDANSWTETDQVAYTTGDANGYVHDGFYTAWQELENGELNTMIKSMFAGYAGANIMITGHSLGAALAQIAALEFTQNSVYTSLSMGNINTITFGSPRWCDETIATLYGEVVDSNWRIVNEHDIVPTLPLMAMGFHHTGYVTDILIGYCSSVF